VTGRGDTWHGAMLPIRQSQHGGQSHFSHHLRRLPVGMVSPSVKTGCRTHCTGVESSSQHHPEAAPATSHLADLHPVADYKCFNSSNVSIRTWSWNYRSCWHQTCPPVDSHHCVWIASIASSTQHKVKQNCCSSSLPRKLGLALGNLRACCPPW